MAAFWVQLDRSRWRSLAKIFCLSPRGRRWEPSFKVASVSETHLQLQVPLTVTSTSCRLVILSFPNLIGDPVTQPTLLCLYGAPSTSPRLTVRWRHVCSVCTTNPFFFLFCIFRATIRNSFIQTSRALDFRLLCLHHPNLSDIAVPADVDGVLSLYHTIEVFLKGVSRPAEEILSLVSARTHHLLALFQCHPEVKAVTDAAHAKRSLAANASSLLLTTRPHRLIFIYQQQGQFRGSSCVRAGDSSTRSPISKLSPKNRQSPSPKRAS